MQPLASVEQGANLRETNALDKKKSVTVLGISVPPDGAPRTGTPCPSSAGPLDEVQPRPGLHRPADGPHRQGEDDVREGLLQVHPLERPDVPAWRRLGGGWDPCSAEMPRSTTGRAHHVTTLQRCRTEPTVQSPLEVLGLESMISRRALVHRRETKTKTLKKVLAVRSPPGVRPKKAPDRDRFRWS